MIDLDDFEKFTGLIKARARSNEISIRKTGQIIFGKGATSTYRTEEFEYALLYFNHKTQEVALKLIKSHEPNSIKLKKQRGITVIWARPFFRHYNLEIKSGFRVTPDFHEEENIFVWKMAKN